MSTSTMSNLDSLVNASYTTIGSVGQNEYDESSKALLDNALLGALLLAIPCSAIMMFTIVGNILVIVSVFNYKPLRNVQNMYLVSLAVADITVALFVMPFNVTYSIMGRWIFGLTVCKMWLTSDVLCCTASILNLSAIALDRYQAIHDPINYAQKRTLQRVLTMIVLIWLISALISIPPLLGWNDWPDDFNEDTPCMLTQERGYVIYSSSGSFFIPLIIMTVVYVKIFIATRRRLRERAKATSSKMSVRVNRVPVPSSSDIVQRASSSSDNGVTDGGPVTGIGNNNITSVAEHSDSSNEPDSPSEYVTEVSRVATNSSRNLDTEPLAICETNLSEAVKTIAPSPMTLTPASVAGKPKKKVTHNPSVQVHGDSKQDKRKKSSNRTEPSSVVKQYWEEKQRISLSRERKAAQVLGIVMGVFVACWLPFFLMYVIVPFCDDGQCPIPRWLENFITWLGYVNSALNPIIYTIFNMDFRKAFQRILCCWDNKRQLSSTGRRRPR
ncbi:putative tyramine receptor 2 [Halotydeus destructor]|nr:putative tyramine receptor 2 [Halotydeus destructor]